METKILFLQIGFILLSIAVCLLAVVVKRISKTDDLSEQSRMNQKFG